MFPPEPLDRLLGLLAFGYLAVVAAGAIVLVVIGHALGRLPWLPDGVARGYGGLVAGIVDRLLWPIDLLPRPRTDRRR